MSKAISKRESLKNSKSFKEIAVNWELYLALLPGLLFLIIFKYWPMYGLQLAFKEFYAGKGIWNSPWVGWDNYAKFFNSYVFWDLIKNTLGISLYQLIAGFPIPIILALMLNHLRNERFKKTVQMITYAPHFISIVVTVGIIFIFLSPSSGIFNLLRQTLGFEPVFYMAKPEYFKTIFVGSAIWQNTGWGTIIYLAALSGISPAFHEAAIIDGATIWQRIWKIDLPSIAPTAVIMLILRTGRIMEVGFEKVFLMQNSLNLSSSEIIATYVYKVGLVRAEYGYSTAVGLFNSLINFILIMTVNRIAKQVGETSLW